MSDITVTKSTDWSKVFDEIIGSLPLGQIIVWGEGILEKIWPEFSKIKSQIAYFVQFAEAVETGDKSGPKKKEKVLKYVLDDVNEYIPSWIPRFFVKPVISSAIDVIVDYLNKNVPNWADEIKRYFLDPGETTPEK